MCTFVFIFEKQFFIFSNLILAMLYQKKSLCLFIHFSEKPHIPYYARIFTIELSRFFDEVVLLTNNKTLKTAPTLPGNVTITFQENIGYDFGRFYNYCQTIKKSDYCRIACVNDSNVLINNLDNVLNWENIVPFDFWGLVDSYEKPWFSTSSENYHLQSHFLIFNQKSIDLLDEYFKSVNIDEILNELNPKILRRKVIDKWEIGLSQFMISKGLKIGHLIDSESITKQFEIRTDSNISHMLYEELLAAGYPLIKKKVIFDEKWKFGKSGPIWKKLIKKYGNPDWKLEILIDELEQMKNDQKEKNRPRLVNKIILHLHRKSVEPDEKSGKGNVINN